VSQGWCSLMDELERQKKIIDGFAQTLRDAGTEPLQFETHISRVLVAGKYAYKFKKAVRLAFLDFSTLDARRFFCEEECRLNRRLAPQIYLDVVSLTGAPEHPTISAEGAALDHAVRMHAFGQDALWSNRLARNVLAASEVDELASKLAHFHLHAANASAESNWGVAEEIVRIADDTLAGLSSLAEDDEETKRVADLRRWETDRQAQLSASFDRRKADGFVRDCHGDLHCANVLTLKDGVAAFDCIEFSDSLRWIDVMNDLAFIHMDLGFRQKEGLDARLLSRYLELTGDYAGLHVLAYYRVHRALVRARVLLLQAHQNVVPTEQSTSCKEQGLKYLHFAHCRIQAPSPAIMILHGYSGSGKSTFAHHAVEILGAVQLRSDVERKRMHGIASTSREGRRAEALVYSAAATAMAYERLRLLARDIATSGWPVLVDATFLKTWQRRLFRELADELQLPFFIFDLQASPEKMRKRIVARHEAGLDASDADVEILERQLRNDDPLSSDEMGQVIVVDAGQEIERHIVKDACAPVAGLLSGDAD
jgi:aminoglycoside phosphotransferase family enzyme/predicted kinase